MCYAFVSRVNDELDRLEYDIIIAPVTNSDWGTPLAVVPNTDDAVRSCVDCKCGVNANILQSNHPVRRINNVLNSLRR